jgi:hypothetical protein
MDRQAPAWPLAPEVLPEADSDTDTDADADAGGAQINTSRYNADLQERRTTEKLNWIT